MHVPNEKLSTDFNENDLKQKQRGLSIKHDLELPTVDSKTCKIYITIQSTRSE